MGFGFGLPGIRISTRGVRVGPRFANVGVGRGGVRASAGPRIAKVSVGRGGVRVGSGVGPLYISNRGAGISVGGMRVSNRGIGASLGAGPFWFGTNTRWPTLSPLSKSRSFVTNNVLGAQTHPTGGPAQRRTVSTSRTPQPRHTSQNAARPGQIFGAPLMNMATQFAQYQNNLAASGVKRRNKYEIRNAAAQSLFFSGASLVSVLRPYGQISFPSMPAIPSDGEIRREARRRLRTRGEIPIWSLGKKHLVANECSSIKTEVENRCRSITLQLQGVLQKVRNFVEPQATRMMNVVLADNLFPARWIGCSNGHGVVVVAFGGVTELVWPEEMTITKSGGVGVKKITKDDLGRRHRQLLVRALLSTAKESLEANPNLTQITIVAIDNFQNDTLLNREVWGFTTVERRNLQHITSSEGPINELISLEDFFHSSEIIDDENEYSFFSRLLAASDALENDASNVASQFMRNVFVNPISRGTWLTPLGKIQQVFSSDSNLLKVFNSATLALPATPDEAPNLHSVDFWLSQA